MLQRLGKTQALRVYICLCVCVCVDYSIYVYIYIRIYIYIYIMRVCVSVCVCVHVRVLHHTRLYMCVYYMHALLEYNSFLIAFHFAWLI